MQTYSLFGPRGNTEEYYQKIKDLADRFGADDGKNFLETLRKMHKKKYREKPPPDVRELVFSVKAALEEGQFSRYTAGVAPHLKGLSVLERRDATLATKEPQYHLYMLEIELVNRLYGERFRGSAYKFALLPHCLRDFRPGCKSAPGDIETVCRGCTGECFINRGSALLKKKGISPYISVEMDQKKLFRKLKKEHPDIGALGVACVPMLVNGMRLCIEAGIPPVGVPLDANRCRRWMKEANESSFSLQELEGLLQ